jgi:hypothetical protein
MMAKLLELKEEMRQRMHWPISEQGKWLRQVVTGFFNPSYSRQRPSAANIVGIPSGCAFSGCGKNCHKPTVRKLVIQRDFPPILGLPMNKDPTGNKVGTGLTNGNQRGDVCDGLGLYR